MLSQPQRRSIWGGALTPPQTLHFVQGHTGRSFSSAVVLAATSMNDTCEGRDPEKHCLPRCHREAFAGMTDRVFSHLRDTKRGRLLPPLPIQRGTGGPLAARVFPGGYSLADFRYIRSSRGSNSRNTGANTRDTMAISFSRMFSDGPEVSLNGSPTMSPSTAALCASVPFPP